MYRPQSHPPTFSDFSVLICPQSELDLEHTLSSGQAFRWKRDRSGWWSAVISPEGDILRCWQDRDQIYYQTYPEPDRLDLLRTYFQLDVDLSKLSEDWRKVARTEIGDALGFSPGLRVLQQDPVECLISFLCSSVSPIYRIRRGIESLCRVLVSPITVINDDPFYMFPELDILANTPRHIYDTFGLGFRGGNIREASKELISRGGRGYLLSLREMPYPDAKAALMSLPGVGAKIADCVCLFSLGKHNAVPLDVHMGRVAKRLFPAAREFKTMTNRAYDIISGEFQSRFGSHAGWAQQYLFNSELQRTGAWDSEMGVHVAPIKKLRPKP